ncbi:transcription factor atoh8 [Leucoraja erinacea]|uniref:transcription factor atoh8 n=1 Tax=Leucoraja erinaceus TaxID=7782 RepID=UPI002454845E|nr:transcription factor atoh8 [Leucoraja erinacea]
MRTSENLEVADWKKLCVRGIGTIKRLKRKSRDVLRDGEMEKIYRVEPDPLIARLAQSNGAVRDASSCRDLRADDAVDLRRMVPIVCMPDGGGGGGGEGGRGGEDEGPGPESPATGRGKPARRPPPSQALSFEPLALAEPPTLLPRIVLCQRSPETSYTPIPHDCYSPTPGTRPGDTSNAPTEIKAIQQTRRLLANARERSRVHTISAAFEALRKQVPCYSYGQKLSKLAILRIACNYILSLATLADLDYSSDHSNMSFAECVEQCTKTLQAEGRSKKRKE